MKILYVLSYLSFDGGVQSVVNNYWNALEKENVQIDFLTLLPGDKKLEDELRQKNCNIYQLKGSEEKNLFLFMKEIKNFFKEHHDYDILHNHQTNLDMFYLREARKWKIPVRIMHAHSTNCDISKVRMTILRKMSKRYANYYFACSEEAGKWMFGRNIDKSDTFYIFNNAIDTEKYSYNEEIRNKIRKENHLENAFIVGNVARMVEMKNHQFLVDIFQEILKIQKNAKLLLIGDGPLKSVIQEKVERLNLQDNVIFWGATNQVHEMLQMMDVFVLPSLYEGVPVSVIEAAASGMKYVISDTIDSHLKENQLELKIHLNDKAEDLAQRILDFSVSYDRKNQKQLLQESGYDIITQASELKEIYKKLWQGEKNEK